MVIRYKISRNELDRLILYKNFMSTSSEKQKNTKCKWTTMLLHAILLEKEVIAWERRGLSCRKD
ncbi:hypothetical protein SELSPUOL_01052 [Selenomonas sputigena ATCC 35185]|uniref:Uncharacterized protein n=1 Tax=Selenomonas sputigena (strain ATCC 35185 / DSM 20758 / CCUG 44933 / VPI D19B-28) TaxID=546271 RepID=C9LTP1_SELS3|nr:hypothetical protein SELSPUOL_01052 [Selenomonas sputigena ATCC 35185]